MAALEKFGRFVLCVQNRGFAASLEVRKVYRLKSDPEALQRGLLRILDESGEDDLYPARLFVPLDAPRADAPVLSGL